MSAPRTDDSAAGIRRLGAAEIAGPEFVALLKLAAEVEDGELERIRTQELARLTVIGSVEDGRLVAFAAFDADADPVVLSYIAVDVGAQGRGLGNALIESVRRAAGGRALLAETDDDAVAFYRRIGFRITSRSDRDPRWPDRPRYDCLLP